MFISKEFDSLNLNELEIHLYYLFLLAIVAELLLSSDCYTADFPFVNYYLYHLYFNLSAMFYITKYYTFRLLIILTSNKIVINLLLFYFCNKNSIRQICSNSTTFSLIYSLSSI